MRFFVVFLLASIPAALGAAEPAPAALEFFENKVRPLLIDNCYACHGEKKQEAGLRLDSSAAFAKGSDAGPVVVPGEPEKSKLIKAVRYSGDIKMPPKGRLPAEAIEALVHWVKLGAPYPAKATDAKAVSDSRVSWGYKPVVPVAVPAVRSQGVEGIDRFILAKLEAKGLSLSPRADSRALIRRAYYDLTGLPPTPEEIEQFVVASRTHFETAYREVIDRLLASPQYGEAQARHWLDLARYSDTKGYVFVEDRNYPYAYTYRDWVVSAFNADMPYDRFVQLQIAADRLRPTDPHDLAAMGFLTVGRRFLNNIHDIIDDRIDVTCRTFLGLTITCARCHDHKFDPIPSKDYYSLYGVFASSIEPKELPLIGEVERTPEVIAFEKELQKLEEDLESLRKKLHATRVETLRKPDMIAAYLMAVRDLRGQPEDKVSAYLRERDLNQFVLNRWRNYLGERAKDPSSIFAPLMMLAAIPDADFASKASGAIDKFRQMKDGKPIAGSIRAALTEAKLTSFKEVAFIYGKLLASSEGLAALGADSPNEVQLADAEKLFRKDDKNKVTAARKKIEAFKTTSPSTPPRAMVLNDALSPTNPYVFLRGNPGNHGPNVPRQFLEILSGPQRKPFQEGSGRLELARAITDPKNPLTARVMVNRIWSTHFGHGLVRTPSDFGVRSDLPTHPELLDWLAAQFVESGWSIKKMHRQIMLSRAYQQTADVSEDLARLDPENRLISRMNRRRLDFEAMRDSLLMVSAQLDRSVGGKPIDIFKEPFSHRRTIYGFIDRQNLPGTFRVFDFASPDQHSPQRFVTTVPQQALFLMNSPFVMEQARQLVARPEVVGKKSPERIAALIRLIHGRAANADEVRLAQAFLDDVNKDALSQASPWQQGYGKFDENGKRVEGFKPLPHWTGSAWQGGPKLPDSALGWVVLNANGGHPGKNFAAIRRWTATIDGEIAISGTVRHGSQEGDGVRYRVVSSRHGEVAAGKIKNGNAEMNLRTSVAKGDVIDFVVDCIDNENSDSFRWSPIIRFEEKGKDTVWDSERDFSGPKSANASFGSWEQFAQVLLLSNEFAFVD